MAFRLASFVPTDKTRWEQVGSQDVQRWIVWLLRRYSAAYARQQYQALRQFFRWLAAEAEFADPMARLRAPRVADKPAPFFTSVELSKLEKACQRNSRAAPRRGDPSGVPGDGPRVAELAGLCYDPNDPGRSDVYLERREIHVRGKGRKDRTVRIDHRAARRLDRYLRVRTRHAQAHRPHSAGT